MRSRTAKDGFTLLEILVVIALLGIVSSWGYVIMFRVDSEWRELRRRTELSAVADGIFSELRRDIDAVVSPRLTGMPLVGQAKMHSDAKRLHELFDDALALPITTTDQGAPQTVRIVYYVDREGQRDRLVRGTLAPGDDAHAGSPLAPGVDIVKLRFEFAMADNGYQWLPGWDRPHLPDAVRVSLTLVDPDKPHIQVSRKAVFDVRVD